MVPAPSNHGVLVRAPAIETDVTVALTPRAQDIPKSYVPRRETVPREARPKIVRNVTKVWESRERRSRGGGGKRGRGGTRKRERGIGKEGEGREREMRSEKIVGCSARQRIESSKYDRETTKTRSTSNNHENNSTTSAQRVKFLFAGT